MIKTSFDKMVKNRKPAHFLILGFTKIEEKINLDYAMVPDLLVLEEPHIHGPRLTVNVVSLNSLK